MMRPILPFFWLFAFTFVGSQAAAQDWVDQVFPERSFDLGNVARGSKLRHTFPVLNRTGQEIRIIDVEKKCGCTEVKIGAREIPPGTKTTIEVELDTTKFEGFKPSGVTLVLDRPEARRVELNITSFIRGEISISPPGNADFGLVTRGEQPKLALTLQYNGAMPNWQITKVETGPEGVEAEATPTSRSGNSVTYQLLVKLDSQGLKKSFKDEITLSTNDPNNPVFPITVAAQVQGRVTISPSTLVLGQLRPGQVEKRKILVRSTTSRPFKIISQDVTKGTLDVEGDDKTSKPLHSLVVTYTAPDRSGSGTAILEIATDVPDEPPAKLSVFATILP